MQKNAHLGKMLKNEYFSLSIKYLLAKIGVDTAENEPEVEA